MSVPRSRNNRPYRHLAAVGPDTVCWPSLPETVRLVEMLRRPLGSS